MSDQPTSTPDTPDAPEPPKWQPLSAIDRRVAGVLVEKAKTTPAAYPMTLNGIVTGANQKSNREPLMNLEPDDVEESLERLRGMGAVSLIQGVGRGDKFRHHLYDWLGVDKVELAVMAELLLRGAQTEGDLRARASRMEPIADLGALRTILGSLKAKGLVVPLTPEGRGHVVTHAVCPPRELERLRAEFAAGRPVLAAHESDDDAPATVPAAAPVSIPISAAPRAAPHDDPAVGQLRHELQSLRTLVAELRADLERLSGEFSQTQDELRRLKSDLGA